MNPEKLSKIKSTIFSAPKWLNKDGKLPAITARATSTDKIRWPQINSQNL